MKINSRKIIAVPLLITGLLGGVSEIIVTTPTAYAASGDVNTDFNTFLNNDKSGRYGNWREGVYNLHIADRNNNVDNQFIKIGAIVDKPLDQLDGALAPYILIDGAKIPSIIQTLQNQNSMELTDLLKLLTTISVAGYNSSSLDIKTPDQKWLSITEPNYTKIQILNTETVEKPLINTVDVNNQTGQTVTGHAPAISVANTDTISTTNTHTAKFGMKQTIKGGISFLGIASGNFSQEFSEEYSYSNATQKLQSNTMTLSSQPVDFPVPAYQHYQADVLFQQTKKSGIVTGTARLGGGYRVRVGTTGNDSKDQLMDISIYKKFKVIQDLYPDLWTALKDKGIDLDDNAKQVLYTGGIGFESLQGVQVSAVVRDLNTGQTKKSTLTNIQNGQNGQNVNITKAWKSALYMK